MGKPRKISSDDNLKQTSLHSFFKSIKSSEYLAETKSSVSNQVDKENHVKLRRKKVSKRKKKPQIVACIDISSDSDDDVLKCKPAARINSTPKSPPKNVITIAKPTPLKTKIDKPMPRAFQPRNLTFIDERKEFNAESFPQHRLLQDLIEEAAEPESDKNQSFTSDSQINPPDVREEPTEAVKVKNRNIANNSQISLLQETSQIIASVNGNLLCESPLKLCKSPSKLSLHRNSEEDNNLTDSEENLESSSIKKLSSAKRKLITEEVPKSKRILLVRKDLFAPLKHNLENQLTVKINSNNMTKYSMAVTEDVEEKQTSKTDCIEENTTNAVLVGQTVSTIASNIPSLTSMNGHSGSVSPQHLINATAPSTGNRAASHSNNLPDVHSSENTSASINTSKLSFNEYTLNSLDSINVPRPIVNIFSENSSPSTTNGTPLPNPQVTGDTSPIPSTSTGITDSHRNQAAYNLDRTDLIDYVNLNLEEYGVMEETAYSPQPDEAVVALPCHGNYEYLSEDAGSLSALRKIMNHVSTSPNLYSVLYEPEKVILKKFFSLPDKYQFVCFRLFTRLPKWFNMYKLIEEIKLEVGEEEVIAMFETLRDSSFVETDYSQEKPANLLNFLLLKDVRSIYKSFRIPGANSKLNKVELISAILKHCSKQSTLTADKTSNLLLLDRICDKMGPCIKIDNSFHHILFRLHLLYSFTNPDLITPYYLYTFMRECTNGKLPTYSLDFARVFISKEEFLRYSLAVEHSREYILAKEKPINRELMLKIAEIVFQALKVSLDSNFNDDAEKISFHRKFTAHRVNAKTLAMACKDFTTDVTRVRVWLQFLLKHTTSGKRGLQYDQLAMIHENVHEYEEAVDVLTEALCDPKVTEIDKYDLMNRGYRLTKRLKHCESEQLDMLKVLIEPRISREFPSILVKAREVKSTSGGRKMYVDPCSNGERILSVEEVAISYYQAKEGIPKGIHCEGGLIFTLFFFLFWDLIFDMYIPGTFVSEIQLIPLDFYCGFYENRKVQVDKRLSDISVDWTDEEFYGFLREQLTNNCDKITLTSRDILHDHSILYEACTCMSRKVLGQILSRLVKDIRSHKAGMPDLFVWNPANKSGKFVEVKSDNDQLSTKQTLWLDSLGNSANVEICYVNSIGTKVKKARMK